MFFVSSYKINRLVFKANTSIVTIVTHLRLKTMERM